jgi:uncharacterized membrane protein
MDSENLTTELSDQDRVLLVFDYLGLLALVSLLATRKEFVKWHAKQGLLLSAAVAALYLVILKPVHMLFTRYLWGFLAELFWALSRLIVVGAVVLALLCIIRALEGEGFKIPLLGELADRL